ncbi:MAG: cytochrome c oxidase accessory protein CcoG [Chitinophagales bacterium]|nr:cytochrome c oxidase accessory protein CcoG [Chitinophagales bacterium]MDW8419002.1 cytochrome c oxidase accessory protein CcoG [Chitinophagales bacterium]
MSTATETFRDSIGTVTKEGKRNWIFAKKPAGKYYNARTVLSWVYLAVFFTLPWIKVNGEPLFLLNILERKFILFGAIFWPQDFFVFALGMLTFMVFVVLFTVVFGRLFCGWVCPQTIFMEMVFRKLEYWIEGDADKQKRLHEMPWNAEKIGKRLLKFIVFFTVSFVIANYFLAYIVGIDNVVTYIREGISSHLGIFIPLLIFTGVFFFVYWWFREQACIMVCPYGRLQGVLLDPNSVVVAYDYVRGEPRGKISRHQKDEHKGDCIDCYECVKVCPTGIDIRNGTQMECVNCTACIDACDAIMTRIKRPTGLIRYASENSIRKGDKWHMTVRSTAYTVVLFLLAGVLVTLLVTRKDIQTTVMRAQGMLYQEQPGDQISNLYNIKLVNKTRKTLPVVLKLENSDLNGKIAVVGKSISVKPESVSDGVFFVYIPKQNLKKRKIPLKIGVYVNGEKIDEVKTTFMSNKNG